MVPDGTRRVLRRAAVPVLALAVLLTGTAAAAVTGSDEPAATQGASATRALVVSGSSLSYAASRRAAELLHWDADVYTLPGAGISRSAHDPAASIVAQVRRLLPVPGSPHDVVVVQGGEADHVAAPETLQRATEHLLDYVQAHVGEQTEIILIGPIPAGPAPQSLRTVNDVLQGVARSRGVAYVDAASYGWVAGDPALAEHLSRALAGG